jgi:hypothetical protein
MSNSLDLNLDLMIEQKVATGETPSLAGQSMGLLLALTYTN